MPGGAVFPQEDTRKSASFTECRKARFKQTLSPQDNCKDRHSSCPIPLEVEGFRGGKSLTRVPGRVPGGRSSSVTEMKQGRHGPELVGVGTEWGGGWPSACRSRGRTTSLERRDRSATELWCLGHAPRVPCVVHSVASQPLKHKKSSTQSRVTGFTFRSSSRRPATGHSSRSDRVTSKSVGPTSFTPTTVVEGPSGPDTRVTLDCPPQTVKTSTRLLMPHFGVRVRPRPTLHPCLRTKELSPKDQHRSSNLLLFRHHSSLSFPSPTRCLCSHLNFPGKLFRRSC